MSTNKFNLPKWLLHLEGGAVALLSIWFYSIHSGDWLLFFILILSPDLTFIAYAGGKTIGAFFYNLLHSYVGPAILLAIYWLTNDPLLLSLALIWTAHIGLDRTIGYGLKYPTDFKDTHLNRV